jgi:hypothetical protein
MTFSVTTVLNKDFYTSPAERDNLLQDLKSLNLYAADFQPTPEMQGRGFVRDLQDLTEDEFARLLVILAKYCGEAKAASAAS